MTNNSRGVTVECIECAWQGDEHMTDTRYCPECGGECLELEEIYGPEWESSKANPKNAP